MERYRTDREALLERAVPGTDAAGRLAALTDEAIAELADAAGARLPGRWAVCALGGWGAGAMLPASDVDVLILAEAPERTLKPFAEAVLYPLWDAGLKVGHQVRSARAHRSSCGGDDLETLTASLTGRIIAGDREYAARALDSVASDARRRRRKVLRMLASRERPGSPYLLEPQLKEGAGGRRDFDELVWTAAVLSGQRTSHPHALVAAGHMTAEELKIVTVAAHVIAAARWELQAAGCGDLMSLDAAADLATDPESVQAALASTAAVLDRVRRRVRGEREAACQPLSAEELFGLLDVGATSLPEVLEAAHSGRLDDLVPGIRELLVLRRPGLTHTLTVGAHQLKAAALLGDIGANGPSSAALSAARASVGDLRPVQAAALAHDAGKRRSGPGHALRGEAPARDCARKLGLDDDGIRDAGDLVRLHLHLIETALRDDIDDEDAVLRAASAIGRRELVAPLHLLTAADSLATGPGAWTPWHDALVGALAARLDAALADDVEGAGLAIRGEAVRSDALASLAEDDARRFVEQAPLRYLASRDTATVAHDAALVASLTSGDAADVRLDVRIGPAPGTFLATVAALDRPELFSRAAGALALAGLDILGADAYPAPDRRALDVFTVSSATKRPVDHSTWQAVERYLKAALRDRLELRTRLAERRRHYPPTARVRSEISTEPGAYGTVVRVTASDRPGLLHDIADAIATSGLDIRWAKAVTADGIARDVFSVVDVDGLPVSDPGVLGHVAMRLREVE